MAHCLRDCSHRRKGTREIAPSPAVRTHAAPGSQARAKSGSASAFSAALQRRRPGPGHRHGALPATQGTLLGASQNQYGARSLEEMHDERALPLASVSFLLTKYSLRMKHITMGIDHICIKTQRKVLESRVFGPRSRYR
jgi:hypothetical protein